MVDISHESLIVLWQKLEQWVDDEARAAEWYDSVCKDVIRAKSGEAGKWRDRQLSVALDLLREGCWNEARRLGYLRPAPGSLRSSHSGAQRRSSKPESNKRKRRGGPRS